MRLSVTAALFALLAGMPQPGSAAAWNLSFATYFGGNDMTAATGIAVDGSGNVYVTGWTVSTALPGCSPVRLNAGGVDAFVAKWDGATHLFDYCTFLGGSGDDRAFAIAVDASGDAYVTGWTMSASFPVTAALQTRLAGAKNAFVAKLNSVGALVYSTYLGGSGSDIGYAIAVDNGGNATVVGDTTSVNFPLSHPIQTGLSGQTNVFVTRLSPSGTALAYSTYLGGSGSDHGASVALDITGAAYLTGSTTSMDFPTVSAFQPTSGGNQDAFVAKIGSTGSSLVYSTYLGGSGGTVGFPETGSAIAVDSAGNAYVAGTTSSPNFPLANALLSSAAGVGIHAFVTKLNPAGSGLVFSTYLGGSSIDQAAAIAVDTGGNAVMAGFTASPDFPVASPTQASLAGSYDAFVARLDPTGTTLLEGTFFGGSGSDAANAVTCNGANAVYVAGQTQSLNLPIENATQPALNGVQDAFIALFTLTPQASAPPAPTALKATAGNWSVALSWTASSGATSYNVYRGTTAGGESATAIASGITATSYSDTGLTNGSKYYYKVAAVNAGGLSPLSAEASVTLAPPAPAAPAGLTATGSGATVIPVQNASFESPSCPGPGSCPPANWTVSAPAAEWTPISGVFNSIPNGAQVAWANAGGSLTQVLTTALALNTTYTLSVTAGARSGWVFAPVIDLYAGSNLLGSALGATPSAGNWAVWTLVFDSGSSNAAAGQLLKISLASTTIQTGFDNVTLTATPDANQNGATTVALSWTASSGATSYNVYRGTTAGGESATAIASGITTTSYSDTGLTNGTKYYYKVAAINAGGLSPLSAEASVKLAP